MAGVAGESVVSGITAVTFQGQIEDKVDGYGSVLAGSEMLSEAEVSSGSPL